MTTHNVDFAPIVEPVVWVRGWWGREQGRVQSGQLSKKEFVKRDSRYVVT